MSTHWLLIARDDTVIWQGSAGSHQRVSWRDVANHVEQNDDIKALLTPDLYSCHRVAFIEAEKKLLAQTVPFSLEDELAEDIDDLHFALGEPSDGWVDVVVIRKQTLSAILDAAKENGIELNEIYTFANPLNEPEIIALSEDDVMLRVDGHASVVASHALPVLLSNLAADKCKVQKLHDGVSLPKGLSVSEGGASFLTEFGQASSTGIDFRQGLFRRGIAWIGYWQQWRLTAIAAAVFMAVLIGQSWWQMNQLEARNLAYRQAIEKVYREAFPGGRVVNPRQQMQTKLNELQGPGSTSSSNMLALLSALGDSPIGQQLEVSGISYEARAAELRLDVLAANFQQVESLRKQLRDKGINAKLQNSSAAGNKVRAKLVLSEV